MNLYATPELQWKLYRKLIGDPALSAVLANQAGVGLLIESMTVY
jgi:hypothetical protein